MCVYTPKHKGLYTPKSKILFVDATQEVNYFKIIYLPMKPKKAEESYETKTKVGQTMFKIKYEGQEGYFLSKEEHKQLENTISICSNVCEKVVQDANNS